MPYEYIRIKNPNIATENKLKEAIEHNSSTLSLMKAEITKIKKVNEAVKEKVKKQLPPIVDIHQENSQSLSEDYDEMFEEEVEYYIGEVNKITPAQLKTELSKALPSRKHYEYERIIRRIQAEIIKDCKDIRDLINIETLLKSTDYQMFLDEINFNIQKINALTEELHQSPNQEQKQEEKKETNSLIFVPTLVGNIRIFDDIETIGIEHYHQFEQLFRSIKEGTFKNVKKLHGDLAGLTEVRDLFNGGRVTFMRLDNSSYAIISAFVKKKKNSNGYRKMISNQFQSYRHVEEELKNNLSNPEFLELNEIYEQELFKKLDSNSVEKPLIYKKGGE